MSARTTSHLTIPRDLMDEWQRWRKHYGYIPQISHVALFAFMQMDGIKRCRALAAFNAAKENAWLESWATPRAQALSTDLT